MKPTLEENLLEKQAGIEVVDDKECPESPFLCLLMTM